jgi:hypothetical protein
MPDVYKVYRLRKWGQKLSEAEIRATEVVARVVYGPHPQWTNQNRGTLYHPTTGEVLGVLDHARKAEDARGLMITGLQERSRGKNPWVQTWWCVAVPVTP